MIQNTATEHNLPAISLLPRREKVRLRGNDGMACDRSHMSAFLYRELERNACGTRIRTV